MDETDKTEDILKQLPEPDVYTMPSDMTHRQMMELLPRLIIRDRFTWVGKIHAKLYEWASIAEPYLSGQTHEPPAIGPLSNALRPSKNKYGIAMLALADTLGKFRPGDAPIEEGKDMIASFKGLVEKLSAIKRTKELIAAEEAFARFVNVWNYRGNFRVQQADYIDNLKRSVFQYLDTLTGVWTGIYEIECRIEGETRCTQLTFDDFRHETEQIYTTYSSIRKHFEGTSKIMFEKIDALDENTTVKICSVGRKIDTAKAAILERLPDDGDDVKSAMRARARELIKKDPKRSLRAVCQQVVDEYRGIPRGYTTADALRKQLSR